MNRITRGTRVINRNKHGSTDGGATVETTINKISYN